MELAVVNHEDYFAKIGDDHKFPINKFSELANYLIKKKIVKKFYKPYPCSEETLKRAHSAIIQDNYKLVKFYDNNEIQLFDLNQDIYENNNIFDKKNEISKKLEMALDTYLSDVKAPKWQPGITWKYNTLKKINSFH